MIDKDILQYTYCRMEEETPMEIVKGHLKATIIELNLKHKHNSCSFYEASTSFGQMTLVVQQFLLQLNQKQIADKSVQFGKRLAQRNALIRQQSIVTPLIYEQYIVKVRDSYLVCATLMQPVEVHLQQSIIELRVQSIVQNLVCCAYKIEETAFKYEADCYLMHYILKSKYNLNIFMDFTKIQIMPSQASTQQDQINFKRFKQQICRLLQIDKNYKLQELMFIKQKPFIFNTQAIIESKCWFDLAMMFNLLPQQKVTIIGENKTKLYSISKLNGHLKFEYKGKIYQNYRFYQGFRLDGVAQLTYDDLKLLFFQEQIIYYMIKDKYVYVRKRPVQGEEYWIINNIQYTDMVLVKSDVNKVEFINFLIGYVKYVEPLIHSINFYAEENILQFEFTNKMHAIRKVVVKFSQNYVVKDQELSMIIQKSKLKNAKLSLRTMQFGDSFLIFLANCDKMINVQYLDISYCSKITQSGINLLLASPLCKNINTLRMCALPMIDMTAIKFKTTLRNLYINQCVLYEQNQQIALTDYKIEMLEAIGVNLSLKLPSTLKYLSINSQISWQGLKQLRNLSLIQLKIRLVESKKNITSFFNNIVARDHPIKAFQQGNSRKTLRLLDVSHSTIRIKQLKPILLFQSMQIFICQNIQKDRFGQLILPSKIVNLSLKGSRISCQQLSELISKTNIFIKLNLANTQINHNQLDEVIRHIKYINFLQLDETQINFKLIQNKGCFQNLTLHIHKLIRDEHESILHNILLCQSLNCKQINFICAKKYESRLVSKINRFLQFYSKNQKTTNQPLININEIPVVKLINFKHKQNINEYLIAVNNKSAVHKQKLFSHTLLTQAYGLPTSNDHLNLDIFNVTLHKVLNLYPQSLLQISIRSNRILGKEVIHLISQYASAKLKSLDFRNCLFTYAEIQQQLFNFPYLQSVNDGEYQISINQQDNCQQQLQKILKFFMKLNQNDKLKIHIQARQISDRQLYFSIMYQIIHHYRQNIITLYFNFMNIPPDQHSLMFWREVLSLQYLQHFHLVYNNELVREWDQVGLATQFQKLTELKLVNLQIDTTFSTLIPQHLHFKDLKILSINFSEMTVNQNTVYRIIKNASTLSRLSLNMQNCANITSISRLSDAIERMKSLTMLNLNFSNCPLKQISILELIDRLHNNLMLQRFELNISNCNVSITELLKCLEKLILTLKFCHILIFDIERKKQSLLRDANELLIKGIQIIQAD